MTALLNVVVRLIGTVIWPYIALKFGEMALNQLSGVPEVYATKLADSTAKTVGTAVQNAASTVTGGLIPPASEQASTGAPVPTPRPEDNAINRLTNPWLWISVAVFGYVAVAGIKQTRGLGRDIGSGVRNTRVALKEDLAELEGDPA